MSQQSSSFNSIPFHEGLIRAGFPSPADDFVENTLDLNDIIEHPASTFAVRAQGDSMIGAGIFPGDVLIVDRSLQVRNGDVIVAMLDGEFTLKRFELKNSRVFLKPENIHYPPIEVSPHSEFEVWGIVICVLHNPSTARSSVLSPSK